MSAKDSKSSAKEAKSSKPQFLINAGIRHDFDPDRLLIHEPDKSEGATGNVIYSVEYQISKGHTTTPILRLPFLHTGFGAGRPEFKKDGVSKKGSELLSFNLAGKAEDPFSKPNPINEFHQLLGDLDNWTRGWARELKILGDTADTNAYDKCYVPLRREPGGNFPDQLTVKLPNSYGRPQWCLWDLDTKKPRGREELGYDTLVSGDIMLLSIWVSPGSEFKSAKYGWNVECWHLYKPPKSYDEGYTSRKEAPPVSPW